MQIQTRRTPPPFAVDDATSKRITNDVSAALQAITTLNDKFIVNDTVWYWVNQQGWVKPTVVNSALYLSETFEAELGRRGWRRQETLDNQRIDAYRALPASGPRYFIDRTDFPGVFAEYFRTLEGQKHSQDTLFRDLYQLLVVRGVADPSGIDRRLSKYLREGTAKESVGVGVEFETGNIASSFRAITKLNNLYLAGYIDLGVFVTSNDKSSCAARIWPMSNRNGSVQELENRNYLSDVGIPLWVFGFAPDGFDQNAPYLGNDQRLVRPTNTGMTKTLRNSEYEVWKMTVGGEEREILRPRTDDSSCNSTLI